MLRGALLVFASTHVLGLVTMALVLRPGMDPLAFSASERASILRASVCTGSFVISRLKR